MPLHFESWLRGKRVVCTVTGGIAKERRYVPPDVIADELMDADGKIWDRMGIRSGNDLYPYLGAPVSRWNAYRVAVGKMLRSKGFNAKNKVPRHVEEILEDMNYHSLNHAITQLGLGTRNIGLTVQQMLKYRRRR